MRRRRKTNPLDGTAPGLNGHTFSFRCWEVGSQQTRVVIRDSWASGYQDLVIPSLLWERMLTPKGGDK